MIRPTARPPGMPPNRRLEEGGSPISGWALPPTEMPTAPGDTGHEEGHEGALALRLAFDRMGVEATVSYWPNGQVKVETGYGANKHWGTFQYSLYHAIAMANLLNAAQP